MSQWEDAGKPGGRSCAERFDMEAEMTKREIYEKKLGTVEGALALIKSGDTIAASLYGNEPRVFYMNLHRIGRRVENVHLWTMLMTGDYPVMTDDSLNGRIDIRTAFYNAFCRNGHRTGRFQFYPMNLHDLGDGTAEADRPNVFVAAVSPMDEQGMVYLSFDLEGSREAQFVLNPLRLQMDKSSWPTATKDCTNLVGRKVGNVFRPSMPSTPAQMEELKIQLAKAGVLYS